MKEDRHEEIKVRHEEEEEDENNYEKKKERKRKRIPHKRNLKRKRDCNESSSLIGYVLVKFNYVMMYAFRCTGLPSYARHK